MRLVSLKVQDFKRVEAVELGFEASGLVPLSGKNAQGKTSVLDGLAWAFGGPRAIPATEQPVRDGADRAVVVAETDTLVVRRTTASDGKHRVTVTSKDGRALSAPQKLLDAIYSELTWDAAAFARMSPKEQRERWIEALGLGERLVALEAKREAAYAERRDANRDVRQIEAQLAGLDEPGPFTPDEEVSAADLMAEIAAAQAVVARHAEELVEYNRADAELSRATKDMERIREELRRVELRHAQALEAKRRFEQVLDAQVKPDLEGLQQRLATVESDNREARAAKAYRETATRLDEARARAAELDNQVAVAEAQKHELISGAELPVDGLTLTDEGLLYGGVPLRQASTAEQLRVSVAVAMALEPELRCLRISEGSLLDAESRQAIDDLARERDFLVLVETVADTPTGAPGEIWIEAGEVVEPGVRRGETPSGVPFVEEDLFLPETDETVAAAVGASAPTVRTTIAEAGETRVTEVFGAFLNDSKTPD